MACFEIADDWDDRPDRHYFVYEYRVQLVDDGEPGELLSGTVDQYVESEERAERQVIEKVLDAGYRFGDILRIDLSLREGVI
jgi:hypothetical protein